MNTPEFYTLMVASVSCLTIAGLIAAGAWWAWPTADAWARAAADQHAAHGRRSIRELRLALWCFAV